MKERNHAMTTHQDPARTAPPEFPVKFLKKGTGEPDTEALLKSYLELERRLTRRETDAAPPFAMDRDAALKALGRPDTPEQYRVEVLENFLHRDPDMERLLHEAGFTQDQVQLIYDLAAEKMVPLIAEIVGQARGATDNARLEQEFGGKDRWRQVKRQIRTWGEKNLPADALTALCRSYEGVMAVHRMMSAGDEPGLTRGGDNGEALSEEQLRRMMNDPKYWRDHDPVLARKVQEGFKRLYPD
jgi:hypothetical protein